MLTKTDLSQIKKIVDTSVEPVRVRVDSIEKRTELIEKGVKNIKSNLKQVKKTVNVVALLFDREDVRLRKRVRTIEDHLGITA